MLNFFFSYLFRYFCSVLPNLYYIKLQQKKEAKKLISQMTYVKGLKGFNIFNHQRKAHILHFFFFFFFFSLLTWKKK